MVNWNSPQTMEANFLVIVKLAHVTSGLYMWEWITHLGFDFKLIFRLKTFKWPVAVYLICRVAALLMVTIDLVMLNVTYEVNCRALYNTFFVAGYICALTSSILVALRTVAIWDGNKYIFWTHASALAAYCGVLFYVAIMANHAVWSPLEDACAFSHTVVSRANFTFAIIFDAGSLILALVGARVRWGRGVGDLWLTLYHQGIIWIVVILVTYSIPLAFLWLNLSELMNLMFQLPAAIALVIAATRLYRDLYEVGHTGALHVFEPSRSGGLRVTNYSMSADQSAADLQPHSAMVIEMKTVTVKSSGDDVPAMEKHNPKAISHSAYNVPGDFKAQLS